MDSAWLPRSRRRSLCLPCPGEPIFFPLSLRKFTGPSVHGYQPGTETRRRSGGHRRDRAPRKRPAPNRGRDDRSYATKKLIRNPSRRIRQQAACVPRFHPKASRHDHRPCPISNRSLREHRDSTYSPSFIRISTPASRGKHAVPKPMSSESNRSSRRERGPGRDFNAAATLRLLTAINQHALCGRIARDLLPAPEPTKSI